MIFLEYVGSRASLSANKLKLSALRWAFFVQGRREPRSCKALHEKNLCMLFNQLARNVYM